VKYTNTLRQDEEQNSSFNQFKFIYPDDVFSRNPLLCLMFYWKQLLFD